MCHSKQHILAKLVHKMRVFGGEDIEWCFDLQLDRFESSDDESCGDVRVGLKVRVDSRR